MSFDAMFDAILDSLDYGLLSQRARKRKSAGPGDNFALIQWHHEPASTSASVSPSPTRPAAASLIVAPLVPPARHSGSSAPTATVAVAVAVAVEEDEWRRKGKGRVGGGGGGASFAIPLPGFASTRSAATPRPQATTLAGLAGGSQSAVVKLVSFASGPARVGALVNYQSHEGEIALEREDGGLVSGEDELMDLVAQLTEQTGNRWEPSRDVFKFTLGFDAPQSEDSIRAALIEALDGHKFAWRHEQRGDRTTVNVVMTAASSLRDENGKLERVYANAKSQGRLHGRIDEAFRTKTELVERGWGHGVDGAAKALIWLTRDGEKPARTADIKLLDDRKTALEAANSWKRSLRSREQRDTAHIVISSKPGTDRQAFVNAARATLQKEFAGHEFAFALHTNRGHLHVHAVVRMENIEGKRLDPKIQDFRRWRETMAEEARERRIPMESHSRFDLAHAPGYKLKDIQMVERGVAPEYVRRRVENSKANSIHVPVREEGRRRANETFQSWTALKAAPRSAPDPTLAPGAVRLYRAERPDRPDSRAPLFTTDRSEAERLARASNGSLFYVDVPKDRAREMRPSDADPNRMFILGKELAEAKQPIASLSSAQILPFAQRAEIAAEKSRTVEDATAAPPYDRADRPRELRQDSMLNFRRLRASIEQDSESLNNAAKGETSMPLSSALIESTLASTRKNFQEMDPLMPESERADFERNRNALLDSLDTMLQQQRDIEARRPHIQGEGDDTLRPRNIRDFTHEARGGEIFYSRHDETGKRGAVAFVDKGKQIEVSAWKDEAVILAALQLSAQKWETITVTGNDAYTDTVIGLAAEHGFKITNPELQDRLRQEKRRVDEPRPSVPGFSEGTGEHRRTTPAFELRLQADSQGDTARLVQDNAAPKEPSRFEGKGDDVPRSREIIGFTPALKDNAIHYARHDEQGVRGETEIIDKGGRIDIVHPTNEPMVLFAAIDLASQKWDRATVIGDESFKNSVTEIASSRFPERNIVIVQEPTETPATLTPAETALRLQEVREIARIEAQRETADARAASQGKATFDEGDAHSPAPARDAREVARSLDDDPDRPTPVEPAASQETRRLQNEQESILDEARRRSEERAARESREDNEEDERER